MFNIFKPKYWANLFKYTDFFTFFCSLVHRLAFRRINLPFYVFYKLYTCIRHIK